MKLKKYRVAFDVDIIASVGEELPEEYYLEEMVKMEFGKQTEKEGKISNVTVKEKKWSQSKVSESKM